ncbi:MAG: DUF2330 domain-containing protein, partial [Bdellovibrionota bacterium]
TTWLKKNKYAIPKDATPWIKHYVDLKWNFIALKINPSKKGKVAKSIASPMLRISFATKRPFFPYRESEARKSVSGREFSLFVIAPTKLVGKYESEEPWSTYQETGKLISRSPKAKATKSGYEFEDSKLVAFLDELQGKPAKPEDFYVQHFRNNEERRPLAEDLYFDPPVGK